MDTILMIVLFALFAVLSDKIGQKPKVPRRPREEGSQRPPPAPAPWPRKAPAQKQTGRLGFEIPELRNDPAASRETAKTAPDTAWQQEQEARAREADRQRELAYERQRAEEEARIRAAELAAYEQQAKIKLPARNPVRRALQIPALTRANAQQAVILAEILGRPKAYRNRPRR